MSKSGTTIKPSSLYNTLTEDDIALAMTTFEGISAFDALECLCDALKAGEAIIYLNGVYTCKIRDLYDVTEIYEGELACEVPMDFYGGPPNECQIFKGNLLLLLVDHFLFQFVRKSDRVQKAMTYAPA